jgi:murein DD-endopeptidase MepM/ murein hydrolase activator NlpD
VTRWAALILCAGWLVGAACVHASDGSAVKWPKALELFQGGLSEIHVSGANLIDVGGRMGTTPIVFYPSGPSSFAAIIGADVEAKPSLAKVLLTATDRAGAQRERVIPFRIKAKAFRKESFNVPPSFDQMSEETLEAIRREQAAFARAFAYSVPERLWEAPFVRPVPQEASASSFGFRRIINGTPRAPHSGTDLSAPSGTEVVAANHGRVVLVGNFFFAGGSVVIDHGGGLFTMYFHLSEFKVEEGATVKSGELIALSGSSGRVTGPHLHWGARLANARIDPLELLTRISVNSENAGGSKSVVKQMEK